jgi:hypothetical protein
MTNVIGNRCGLGWKPLNRASILKCCFAWIAMGPVLVVALQESPDLENIQRQKLSFFEKSVRPVLLANCSKCHGSEKQESGLRVDHISFLKKGGDTGPAVIPGKPDESVLITSIEHSSNLEMPPSKKLPDHQIKAIRKWVLEGAYWTTEKISTDAKGWNEHWAFQKIANPVPPEIKFKNGRLKTRSTNSFWTSLSNRKWIPRGLHLI